MDKSRTNLQKLTLLALFTAMVVLLQFLGSFIRFGTFSVSLVQLPIVVGAALTGGYAGAWLGLVFGIVVLLSGDASLFLAINPGGTMTVVLLKGILAGFAAGVVYRAVAGRNRTAASLLASVTFSCVNTGIFLGGTYLFFLPAITEMATAGGFSNVTSFVFLVLIGGNFLFELGTNLVLSPVAVRLVQYGMAHKAR